MERGNPGTGGYSPGNPSSTGDAFEVATGPDVGGTHPNSVVRKAAIAIVETIVFSEWFIFFSFIFEIIWAQDRIHVARTQGSPNKLSKD
jgi:hypothetical protein